MPPTSSHSRIRDADFYTAIYAAPELAAAVAEEGPLRLSRSLDIWAGGLCVLGLFQQLIVVRPRMSMLPQKSKGTPQLSIPPDGHHALWASPT